MMSKRKSVWKGEKWLAREGSQNLKSGMKNLWAYKTENWEFSARAKMNFSIFSRKINICEEEILWTWLIDFRDSMNLHRQTGKASEFYNFNIH